MFFQSQIEGPTDDIELAASVMDRHVAPFASIFTISKELVHKISKRETTLLEDASLSVLTEYDIFGGQCRSRSDCDAFFAC